MDNAAGQWVFSGISRFLRLCILVLLHTLLHPYWHSRSLCPILSTPPPPPKWKSLCPSMLRYNPRHGPRAFVDASSDQQPGETAATRPSISGKVIPRVRNDGSLDYDVGSMESHGSVVSHLLSQVKIGMDLTKVVLPTFILERRSLLEMYADYFAHPDMFVRHQNLYCLPKAKDGHSMPEGYTVHQSSHPDYALRSSKYYCSLRDGTTSTIAVTCSPESSTCR
ncbi:hypothetical protein PR048_020150 [Dryococelus australis]|uniref:Uncharacterized protein n=1 Tax=Dryococelus australis TaxID=614101 RepID=A0ABQ9H5G6_9NEOP|nr:hypothetical protein PR048_020150 [Dryococelus australis]